MKRIARFSLLAGLMALLAACSGGWPRPLGLFGGGGSAGSGDEVILPAGEEPETEEPAATDAAEGEDPASPETPPAAASGLLGTTVASLGDPTAPGLWLETPLVSAETPGRVTAENGQSAAVTLRPSGGDAGSGSRISLAAMQALGLSLTDLPVLTVTAGP